MEAHPTHRPPAGPRRIELDRILGHVLEVAPADFSPGMGLPPIDFGSAAFLAARVAWTTALSVVNDLAPEDDEDLDEWMLNGILEDTRVDEKIAALLRTTTGLVAPVMREVFDGLGGPAVVEILQLDDDQAVPDAYLVEDVTYGILERVAYVALDWVIDEYREPSDADTGN